MRQLNLKLAAEAKLLGSWAFIIKASIAMFAGFALGQYIPLVNRDMISFLFAMMLTLEPVSTAGLRRGLEQFRATLVGGVLSGIIVAVVGINPLGLALSIGAILYFTLAKDWRNLSVVALFTGIYMTQFLQQTPAGTPDILLTMLVRILALSAGILYAILFNGLVSLVDMRHMPTKRLCFVHYRLSKHLQRLNEKLKHGLPIEDSMHLTMSNLFNDIDWNLGLLRDLHNDPLLTVGGLKKPQVQRSIVHLESLRTFTHYLFDLEIQLRDAQFSALDAKAKSQFIAHLDASLKAFALYFDKCDEGQVHKCASAPFGASLDSPLDLRDTANGPLSRMLFNLKACGAIIENLD